MPLFHRAPVAGRQRRPKNAVRPPRGTARARGTGGRLSAWRLVGALLAIASAGAAGWLVTTSEFDLDAQRVELSGLRYASPDEVRAVIGLPVGATPNVFGIAALEMERALTSLPSVAVARVSVLLPDRLVVEITEREPVFAVRTLESTYLLDGEGVILHEAAGDDQGAFGLPVIDDVREQFAPDLAVGGRLDEVSLAATLRLAALTPESIGSTYPRLMLSVDDAEGYVLAAEPDGWRAVFGHYTPNLRPVDIIDSQVQCLEARVAAGERDVDVIYLAPLDERCGTYLPRSTPVATASPAPAR